MELLFHVDMVVVGGGIDLSEKFVLGEQHSGCIMGYSNNGRPVRLFESGTESGWPTASSSQPV